MVNLEIIFQFESVFFLTLEPAFVIKISCHFYLVKYGICCIMEFANSDLSVLTLKYQQNLRTFRLWTPKHGFVNLIETFKCLNV